LNSRRTLHKFVLNVSLSGERIEDRSRQRRWHLQTETSAGGREDGTSRPSCV